MSCSEVLGTKSYLCTFQRPRTDYLFPKKTNCPRPWRVHPTQHEETLKGSEAWAKIPTKSPTAACGAWTSSLATWCLSFPTYKKGK